MTQELKLAGSQTVLEIGTGSGFQAAILSQLAKKVYSIERIAKLADRARSILQKLKISNVSVLTGNGIYGYAKAAPYDAIIITAAAVKIPPRLISQLKNGGRMVIPLVEPSGLQILKTGLKKSGQIQFQDKTHVSFVPLIGKKAE